MPSELLVGYGSSTARECRPTQSELIDMHLVAIEDYLTAYFAPPPPPAAPPTATGS